MKNQAFFSSKDKSKKLKCRLLQFLFGALRVSFCHPGNIILNHEHHTRKVNYKKKKKKKKKFNSFIL